MEEKRKTGRALAITVVEWLLIFSAALASFVWSLRQLPVCRMRVEQAQALWSEGAEVTGTAQAQDKARFHLFQPKSQRVLLRYKVEGVTHTAESEMDAKRFQKLDSGDGSATLLIRYDRADPSRTVTEPYLELTRLERRAARITLAASALYVVGEPLLALYLYRAAAQERKERREEAERMERLRAAREQRKRRAQPSPQPAPKPAPSPVRSQSAPPEPSHQTAKDAPESPDQTVLDAPESPDPNQTVLDAPQSPVAASPDTVLDTLSDTAPPEATILESHLTLSADAGEPPAFAEPEAVLIPPIASDTLERGRTLLDTYRIEDAPKAGGMGSVWRVHHLSWDMDMAMKRAQPQAFQTEEQRSLFIRECENWVELGLHPNIVTCYYVREVEGMPTAFSEWAENGSLKDRIMDGSLYAGTPSEVQERLLDIAIQFARGLHYAHRQKLTHRDVKPDNVLLTLDWEAKVGDFGLTGAAGGFTLAYCSPEQAARKKVSRKTDIYSWAVSVLEMYLGRRVWREGPMAGAACQDYFALSDPAAPLPEDLKPLLASCLAAETKLRPRDFVAVERELKDIYARLTGQPYPRPAPRAVQEGADILNNRALSYLDMGKPEEAERLWRRASFQELAHTETLFNRTLYSVRSGEAQMVEVYYDVASNGTNHYRQAGPNLLYAEMLAEMDMFEVMKDILKMIREAKYRDSLTRSEQQKLERLEALKPGDSYRCAYQVSRVRSRDERSQRAKRQREVLKEIRAEIKQENWSAASYSLFKAYYDASLYEAVFQPDWMEVYRALKRQMSPFFVIYLLPVMTLSVNGAWDRVSFDDASGLLLCGQRLYDLHTGDLLADNGAGQPPTLCSALSPDGAFYLRRCEDGKTVEQVEARTGAALRRVATHSAPVTALSISRDGRLLASGDEAGHVCLTPLGPDAAEGVMTLNAEGAVHDIQLGFDNRKVALRCEKCALLWLRGEDRVEEIPGGACLDLSLDLKSEHLLTGEGRQGIAHYYIEEARRRRRLMQDTGEEVKFVSKIAFMGSDELFLATANGHLSFYDIHSEKRGRYLRWMKEPRSIASSRNMDYIAAVDGNRLHLWRFHYAFEGIAGERERRKMAECCAWVQCSAAPERTPEELTDSLLDELADRGYGGMSRETALEILRRTRARKI